MIIVYVECDTCIVLSGSLTRVLITLLLTTTLKDKYRKIKIKHFAMRNLKVESFKNLSQNHIMLGNLNTVYSNNILFLCTIFHNDNI